MNDYKIRSLAPFNNDDGRCLEGYPVYEGYFKKAIEDKDINKIAVTGNFGIGKSSFIRCFAQKNKKDFFYVSLENFKKLEEEIPPKGANSFIEYNLLKNIVYQCNQRQINASGIELVRGTESPKHVLIASLYSLLLTLCIVTLKFSRQFSDFMHGLWGQKLLNISFHHIHMCLYVFLNILLALGAGHITHFVLTHIRLSKLSVKASNVIGDSDAEIVGNTVLDEYGKELIYIFEVLSKKYSAFIFEDFDRVDYNIVIDILTFLYDLNTIVNVRLKNKKATPIKFCFVVNDLIISEMHATKCFDYIMPIIPELGSNMSCDYFDDLLKKDGIYIPETHQIWKSIQLITDYRTINQILNEFNIILSLEKNKKVIITPDLETCMLAFSIYKVVFPEDYYKIKLGKSIVFPTYKVSSDNTKDPPFSIIDNIKMYLDSRCLTFIGFSETMLLEWKETQIIAAAKNNAHKEIIIKELNLAKKSKDTLSFEDKGKWLCVKLLIRDREKSNQVILLPDAKMVYFLDLVCCLLAMKTTQEKKDYFPYLESLFSDLKDASSNELTPSQKKDVLTYCENIFVSDYSKQENINITSTAIRILYDNGMKDFDWLIKAVADPIDIIRLIEHLYYEKGNDEHKQMVKDIMECNSNSSLKNTLRARFNYFKDGELRIIITQ